MPIKTQYTVKPPAAREITYPALARAKHTGNIWLLKTAKSGTIVMVKSGAYEPGDTSDALSAKWEFLEADEVVELSNAD